MIDSVFLFFIKDHFKLAIFAGKNMTKILATFQKLHIYLLYFQNKSQMCLFLNC